MSPLRNSLTLALACSFVACAVGADPDYAAPAVATQPPGGNEDAGFVVDAPPSTDPPPAATEAVIYATTNTELWRMDPITRAVSKIGAFDFGGDASENMTDVAVNGAGEVWVCSEAHVWQATLPAGGTGPVALTLKLTLPTSSKFYALGFAPAGVLETGEGLVAGDSRGDLYYLPTSSATPTLQKLGGFGGCRSGDPSECGAGAHWELSGDVVFFTAGGAPKGLATLRACTTSGSSTSCDNTNDVVAEIDMAALATKSPSAVLRKRLLGGGTGFARTFGVGAWGSEVYAFTYGSKSDTPALISIGGAGSGALEQSFTALASGWTGAGVSTKAAITVIQ